MNIQRSLGLVLLAGGLFGFSSIGAQPPDPPEVPARERWVRVEANAPMFRLRNDAPDTRPSPDGSRPQPPAPPREDVDGQGEDSEPGPPAHEPPSDTLPEESTSGEKGTKKVSSTTTEDTKSSPSPGTEEKPKTDEAGGTKRKEPATERTSRTKSGEAPPLPTRRETRYTGEEPHQPLETAGFDSPVIPDTPAVAQGLMPAENGATPPPADSWDRWWWLGGVGAVVLGVGGLFFWMRRPRTRVVETASVDTYEYFRRKFEESGLNAGGGGGPTPARGGADRTSNATPRTPPDREASEVGIATWKRGDDQLRRAGIDPSYRPLLKQYYDEGRGTEEIARNLDVGEGEVGLVLDLARRNFSPGRTSSERSPNRAAPTSSKT